jgi:hypothetical protein
LHSCLQRMLMVKTKQQTGIWRTVTDLGTLITSSAYCTLPRSFLRSFVMTAVNVTATLRFNHCHSDCWQLNLNLTFLLSRSLFHARQADSSASC